MLPSRPSALKEHILDAQKPLCAPHRPLTPSSTETLPELLDRNVALSSP